MSSERLREARTVFLSDTRLRGRRFCDAYTALLDKWLTDALAQAIRRTNRRVPKGLALLAVGSYGRGELCPQSDLDLVLVHDNIRGIATIADALWYPIWDAGLQLDHSVRTPRETATVARDDLKATLGLLGARLIAGDSNLATDVRGQVRERWSSDPRGSLGRLREAIEERWSQHGELAFLLEPDVKLARGGLRDLEALQAAALASPLIGDPLDDPRLEAAGETLLAVRVALHIATGRRSDRLLLEDQPAVARALGHTDADELLREVARAARRIGWVDDCHWRRVEAKLAKPRRQFKDRSVEPGIALRAEELVLDGAADAGSDSALPFRIAAASARTGIPISEATLAELENNAPAPTEPWPRETLDALLDLLGCGRAAVPLFETLDQLGILTRYIPEWAAVRGRPERKAYHRFTVDRHLLETAACAAELSRSVGRPDLLLIAAWLHDIGKGFPGDHDSAGERLAADIGRRMGFDASDIKTLARLVRDHRLLMDTATRRDLDDPATVEAVAKKTQTDEDLNLLAALTHAAAMANRPAAWSAWNTRLVDDLVERTRAHLTGERPERGPLAPSAQQRALMAHGELRLLPEGSHLTVVAPDRHGLLSIIAGVLAVNKLSVRTATAASEEGMAADVFDLDLEDRDPPDWADVERQLVEALGDPQALHDRLERRMRSSRMPLRPGAARLAPSRVIVDNDATPRSTIIEVRTSDRIGLLSRIARALAEHACDITFARLLTLGHEVVDTFYITDEDTGGKITDVARLAEIERAILTMVDDDAPLQNLEPTAV